MKNPLKSLQIASIKQRTASTGARIKTGFSRFINANPFLTFFGVLGILLILIVIGNYLRKPPESAIAPEPEPTLVDIYQPGDSPVVNLTGKIEQSGIITIVAQTGGIVQKINIEEGEYVKKSKTLINLSATYQGGNPASVGRQIAQKNVQFNQDNFEAQKSIINTQRDLANQSNVMDAELRSISRKSLDETHSLIALNEEIIATLDRNIADLESQPTSPANEAAILATKQGKAGAMAGLNQLKSALRNTEYTAVDDKAPANLSNLSKDLTLKQLDLQEKSLTLNKEISELNLKLARISESMYFPVTPCPGIVERVFVKPGQTVTPGTPIATIKADDRQLDIVVPVSIELAQQVSEVEASTIIVNGKKISLVPRFVSTQPTEGALAAIFYTVPEETASLLEGKTSVSIQVPLAISEAAVDEAFIPLDAIYQTQDISYVYVIESDEHGHKAKTKTISLGEVSGRYVKVLEGIAAQDQIISSRGVTEGDRVRTE